MTVKELINALLKYDADEIIDFVDEEAIPFTIVEMGKYSDLPYIMLKQEEL